MVLPHGEQHGVGGGLRSLTAFWFSIVFASRLRGSTIFSMFSLSGNGRESLSLTLDRIADLDHQQNLTNLTKAV